ncbi:RagB/SusD family nutrient uptake outer membrane protein [Pseudobacter ginsenosidimutans]|uniref:SusD-like starch-binding protein associating with outer membrane n=1 Tax=Pseudobacter ginsenosidimutans TaxID=661488 RepID=A0A4Q7MZD7_9BACT|nr:RagB/SusD family nutrient uptake outer membrane protein [Pseudobacter ginsenosidimutans]RZS74630.1 SusD-like starch-binding protein associating with outer membrane [Pseudobacter ginsenosidimutans]
MKISRLYITALMVAACCTTACNKEFLELKNPQSLPLTGTIKDLATLTTAANGAYLHFKDNNYYSRTFTLVPDLLGDNVFISRSNGGRFLDHDNFAIVSTDGYTTACWNSMYRVIGNANLAIAEGEKLDPTAPIQQVIGELYAVRALAYFDLVRFWAQPYNFTSDASHMGVPIVTEPQTGIISPARATVKEVYERITEDLKKALTLMNVSKKNGYMVPAAAQTLLAKAYLYMGNWELAEQYATEAINGPFTLLPRASYVASWATDYSSESLFEVVNLPTDNAGTNSLGYIYEQSRYGEGLATQDLYDQYTGTDVRRSLIIVGVRNATFENPAYFVKKYPRGASTNDDHIKVLRLSDAYLIRAEARAELGKSDPAKTTLAQQDLTTIVQRADNVAAAITLTGDALIDRIILERRKEFAFEGHRLFDLNRRKMDVRHIRSTDETIYTYPNNRFIMPIPFAETKANRNMKQNPGWAQ